MEIERIKRAVDRQKPEIKSGSPGRASAVLLPLIYREGQWQLLFEVRSSHLSAQPGEICFPGGRIDEGESSSEAAVREVCEELLVTAHQIELLGEVDGTIGPNGSPIWAYVGIIHDYEGTMSHDEVEECFLVPLQALEKMCPCHGTVRQKTIPQEDFPFEFVPNREQYRWAQPEKEILFYPWKDYMIWGVTARILHSFLEREQRVCVNR